MKNKSRLVRLLFSVRWMNGWMGIRTTFNIKIQKYTNYTRKNKQITTKLHKNKNVISKNIHKKVKNRKNCYLI